MDCTARRTRADCYAERFSAKTEEVEKKNMNEWIKDRTTKYREFFGFGGADIIPPTVDGFEVKPEIAERLRALNFEWHFVPSGEALPCDDGYFKKLYPTAARFHGRAAGNSGSVRSLLIEGHERQQGFVVAVETTQKPVYLPRNRQFYGSSYGHDATLDPLGAYFGKVGITTGTRFEQSYLILRKLFNFLNEDWQKREILPEGYRVTVCPPGIFNLVGTIFHPEWSETESLELGFYRDEKGNATCFAVGANAPGDFSYIDVIENEEWSLTGFRLALLPDETRYDAR